MAASSQPGAVNALLANSVLVGNWHRGRVYSPYTELVERDEHTHLLEVARGNGIPAHSPLLTDLLKDVPAVYERHPFLRPFNKSIHLKMFGDITKTTRSRRITLYEGESERIGATYGPVGIPVELGAFEVPLTSNRLSSSNLPLELLHALHGGLFRGEIYLMIQEGVWPLGLIKLDYHITLSMNEQNVYGSRWVADANELKRRLPASPLPVRNLSDRAP